MNIRNLSIRIDFKHKKKNLGKFRITQVFKLKNLILRFCKERIFKVLKLNLNSKI